MTRVWDEEGATTPHDGAPPRRVRKHVHQGLGGSGLRASAGDWGAQGERRAPGTGGLRAQGECGGLGGSGRAPCAGDWGAQGEGETLLGAKPDGEAGRRRRLPRGERGPGLPATWAPRRPRPSPAKVTAQTR